MSTERDNADMIAIDNWFQYHKPDGNQAERYGELREAGGTLARAIVKLVPAGADRTAALRKVREAIMTANAGIACDEHPPFIRR